MLIAFSEIGKRIDRCTYWSSVSSGHQTHFRKVQVNGHMFTDPVSIPRIVIKLKSFSFGPTLLPRYNKVVVKVHLNI